jgi:hypothetical protein
MRKLIAILIMIPSLCLAGTNLMFNPEEKTSAKVNFSTETGTSFDFNLKGLTTETVSLDNREFLKTLPLEDELVDWGFTGEEGRPDLPVYATMVIIPDQSGVQVNIISSEYETYQDVDVSPLQPWTLESGEQETRFAMDEDFYRRDEFYPRDLVSIGEPMIIRDFRFVQAVVHPVQYNPATKELRVYTYINYELDYSGTDNRNVKHRRNNRISESFLQIYRSVFSNADEVLTDYEPVRGGYIIITPDNYQFPDTIAVLARWKHLKGYYTSVVPSTAIAPSGTPSYAQVHSFIQNAYQNWEIPPDYVLIVGDEDQRIPDYPYSSYASDHQYSTVDGTDYFSDLFIARMSIDNMNELRTAMYKVIRYEQDPYMGDPGYWKRGLGVAGNIGATSPRITNLWVRDLAIDHGYTQVDTVFDWGGGAPNWSTIPTAINNGVSYVSYRGWAGSSGWYNPSYTVTNIGQLTNGWKIGIMASIVCGTGNFGADVCFGEAWIRYGSTTAPKGGPCFYGCTDGGTHTAWNNPNMTGFFWALFEENIYNFSQLMFMGKLRIFEAFPTFTEPGGYVNKYFNTYNSLGDPELQVRTEIPRTMIVSHPSSMPAGTNHMDVSVTGIDGPLEGAYVNLVKGYELTEEIFEGGRTDAIGHISFDFSNTSTDTIFVTVTARDYIPHLGQCVVTTEAVSIGFDSLIVNDSGGNNDGDINPGEPESLTIRLHNFGNSTNATGVSGTLTSPDNRVTIISGTQSYPNIPYGGSADPNSEFAVELAGDVPHGDRIPLQLDITSNEGSWQILVMLEVVSAKPSQIAITFPDIPGNRINPGQTANMVADFTNAGALDGVQISGVLSCDDEFITIVDNYGYFGDIDAGQPGNNSADPFRIAVDEEAYNGRNVNFTIVFTANNPGLGEIHFTRTFSIVIGTINTFDPVGPDRHGYYMYDNTDLGYSPAPFFDWIEINPNLGGSGTRLSIAADDASVLFTLPFDIRYYGDDYGHMIISTNGFVAFDTIPYDVGGNYWHNWDNWPIPDFGNARAQISPFWDDLEFIGSTNGIYTYHDADNGMFIVEWSGCRHARTGSPETFQIIFYDADMYPTPTGDCEILYQYLEINNDDFNDDYRYPESYSSVGFEDWEQDDGLQYEYDNMYHPGAAPLQDGLAIKITTATGLAAPPDMAFSPDEFTMACEPGGQATGNIYIENNGDGYLFYALGVETFDELLTENQPANSPLKAAEAISPVITQVKGEEFSGPYNPPVILDSGGPDNYGYTWIDSDEPSGPVYNWIDISSIGTPITWPSDEDDGTSMGNPIGFSFPFYGNNYTTMNICTNGFISFTSASQTYSNVGIPSSEDPNNMLAVYWDDLNFEPRGACYRYTNNIDTCIVSYVGVPHYSDDGLFTFQVIMLASGKIVYQYLEATGIDINQETIGIENSTGTDGLQVCYNAAYVHAGLAIEFFASPRWLFVNPTTHVVDPHSSDTVTVTCDASELEVGQYEGVIHMQTNDLDYPAVDIPVHFTVFIPGDCEFIPGDINSDGEVNITDITYGVQFFKDTGAVPPDSCWNYELDSWLYAAGDVNGNCAFTGSDISYLVEYFRGHRPEPDWCPQTPPPPPISSDLEEQKIIRIRELYNK